MNGWTGDFEVPGRSHEPAGQEQKSRLISAMWGWNKKSASVNAAVLVCGELAQ